jgi:excinuclease UvrABC nuclease subunit
LDKIDGLGPKLKQKLLLHFTSPENISNATEEQIAQIVGSKLAKKIKVAL